jgi:adenylate kinase
VRVIVLLGGPGAGKGTQAPVLAQRLGLAHVSTGDLFRAAVRDGTPLGVTAKSYMDRGELVPDQVTIDMLLERVAQPDAAAGVILDGFPRTAAQADALDRALAGQGQSVELAPYIEISEDEMVRRLASRWVCRQGGHVYNAQVSPPRVAGVCDVDGSELYQRDDDKPEVVRARLAAQLPPLYEVVDHYRRAGKLESVDGNQAIDDVTAALLSKLAGTGTAR